MFELPPWKGFVSAAAAIVLGLLFIVSGVWKITDPFGWATRVNQMLMPAAISLPLAILVGTSETFGGVLLLVPRFRRWGAWITGLLLVGFMVYFAINFKALAGAECSCFPWVKRVVGPGFFIGDAAMLLLAVLAGVWAPPPFSLRGASVILAAVAVFAGVSFGVNYAQQSGAKAPSAITVNGQPYSLQHGRFMLFFYDPECSHCDAAARAMSKYNWSGDVTVVAVPTREPRFAKEFLDSTGLKAVTSLDLEKLKQAFPFQNGPYGVALENGRQKASLRVFEGDEPEKDLRQLGFVR